VYGLVRNSSAEFEWKAVDPHDQIIDTHRDTPQPLGQFKIQITLTKRRTMPFQSGLLQQARINEDRLTDEAFRPKTYAIRLEKGNFITPAHAKARINTELTERFALRLAFDKSPYPPRHEWKEAEGGPDANQFWDWKEFAGRESPELKKQAESRSQWNHCITC
jgi:hypothetical protein